MLQRNLVAKVELPWLVLLCSRVALYRDLVKRVKAVSADYSERTNQNHEPP